jgi:hypothetical protein
MAAACEPRSLFESACGIAFEVDIKKPEGSEVMTPVRARLEKEVSEGRPLPRLLRSSHDQAAKDDVESPMKEIVARVRARNEEKKATAQRAKQDLEKFMDQKRTNLECALEKAFQQRQTSLTERSSKAGEHFEKVKAKVGDLKGESIDERRARLEEDLERASQQRQTSLTERSSKAGEHFEKVKAKVGDLQRQQADTAAEQQRLLEEDLAQKGAAHSTGVTKRSTKAGEHNSQVAEKVQENQKQKHQRLDELRKQQQEMQLKAQEVREQHLRKGSAKSVSSQDP